MPRRYNRQEYEDEYDDGYGDHEEYDEEEEQGWEQEQDKSTGNPQTPASAATAGNPANDDAARATQTSAPTAAAPSVWRCPACTYDNAAAYLQCEICGTQQPPQQATAQVPEPFPFDTPSPDDAVREAQSRGLSKPTKHTATISKSSSSSKGASPALPSSVSGSSAKGKKASSTEASHGAQQAATAEKGQGKGKAKSAQEAAVAVAGEKLSSLGLDSADRGRDGGSAGGRGEGSSKGPAQRQTPESGVAPRRPVSEYKADSWILEAGARVEGGKQTVHLVVIGHVDAGKSTLTGHLLHCMGRVTGKEMHKNRRESSEKGKGSFAYAWVLDEGSEERERGVTMTLAVAEMETPHLHVKLLDAPGHRDFVPSMIAGAAQADAAILVIDATPGALEAGLEGEAGKGGRGQTWEHMQLARSSGVDQLIVAVNKMDVVDYSEDVFTSIKSTLAPHLKHSGYKDSTVSYVPLSGLEGENLDKECQTPKLKDWYKGPCLLDAIDGLSPPPRDLKHPLRVPISEVIPKSRTLGQAAVSGKLEAGGLKPGLKLLLMPGGHAAAVKGMEVGGEGVKEVVAGQSVDVGLTGVEPTALFAGAVLCHPEFPVPEVRRFEARVLTLECPVPILRGSQVVLHVHCAKEAAVVSRLEAVLDPKTGQPKKLRPRAIPSNSWAIVEVTTERSVCLELYSDFRSLGRIALREGGRTMAVGIVTKMLPYP